MAKEKQKYIRIGGVQFVTIAGYAEIQEVSRQTVYKWLKRPEKGLTTYNMLGRTLIKID